MRCGLIEAFTIWSVYRNKLGHEFEYLAELRLLFSDFFFCILSFGDVAYRPDILAIAGCVMQSMSYSRGCA